MPVAKKLYEAKGDVAVLKKAELYALLVGLKVQGLNAQSGLASILIPKWQALVPTAVREGMEGWDVCARVFWQPELQPAPALQLPAPAAEGAGGPIVITDPGVHVSPADKDK